MSKHPVEQKILDNIQEHTEIYSDAGNALIALLERHQPIKEIGRLRCSQCYSPSYGRYPYPCFDLRAIAHELGVDLKPEIEAIALSNFDWATQEQT